MFDIPVDRAIDELPDYIDSVAKDIYKKTGLAVTIMVGGPIPSEQGQLHLKRCVDQSSCYLNSPNLHEMAALTSGRTNQAIPSASRMLVMKITVPSLLRHSCVAYFVSNLNNVEGMMSLTST